MLVFSFFFHVHRTLSTPLHINISHCTTQTQQQQQQHHHHHHSHRRHHRINHLHQLKQRTCLRNRALFRHHCWSPILQEPLLGKYSAFFLKNFQYIYFLFCYVLSLYMICSIDLDCFTLFRCGNLSFWDLGHGFGAFLVDFGGFRG